MNKLKIARYVFLLNEAFGSDRVLFIHRHGSLHKAILREDYTIQSIFPVQAIEARYDLKSAKSKNASEVNTFFSELKNCKIDCEYFESLLFFWEKD